MAQITITMSVDNDGELVQDPAPALVEPGDMVFWRTDDGDLAITFASAESPFVNQEVLRSAKGLRTPPAHVRHDVPLGAHFECTVTIGDRTFEHVSGVDTPGSP